MRAERTAQICKSQKTKIGLVKGCENNMKNFGYNKFENLNYIGNYSRIVQQRHIRIGIDKFEKRK